MHRLLISVVSICLACTSAIGQTQPDPPIRGFGGSGQMLICHKNNFGHIDCATVPSPAVRAFGDNKFWMTLEPMGYVIGSTNDQITVPKGFVTDFASIPQSLWSLGLSPHGQYSRAAVVHDFLYWSQGCTREQSDRLLLLAMKESNVGSLDEALVYAGVSVGGQGPWNDNAEQRKAGLPRIVPEQYLQPTDPNILWPEYQQFLVLQGTKDPEFAREPKYCAYGNSTRIP